MAATVGTCGLVADHCRATQHVFAILVGEKTGSSDHWACQPGLFIQVAGQAGFGLLVDQRSDFVRIRRMDHRAVFAENSDPVDIVLDTGPALRKSSGMAVRRDQQVDLAVTSRY